MNNLMGGGRDGYWGIKCEKYALYTPKITLQFSNN